MKAAERFERKVVFRVSRGLLTITGVVIFFAVVVSTLYLCYGLIPAFKSAPPAMPPKPQAPAITFSDVQGMLPRSQQPRAIPAAEPAADREVEAAEAEPAAVTIAITPAVEAVLTRIQAAVPGATWNDVTQSVCVEKHFLFDTCLRYETQTTEGLRSKIVARIKDLAESDRLAYLGAIEGFLPKVAEPFREIALFEFLAIQGDVPALVTLGRVLAEGLPMAPAAQQALFIGEMAKVFAREENVSTYLATMLIARELAAILPIEQRIAGWFVSTRFLMRSADDTAGATALAGTMKPILTQLEETQRLQGIKGFARLYGEKTASARAEYESALQQRAAKIAENEREVARTKTARANARTRGLQGVGVGIAVLAVVGWFLALLGIERNTRMLEELIREQSRDLPKAA
jgi:ElaB/YqjD/DUF883 family membrane-anchored ribosome-binding protein